MDTFGFIITRHVNSELTNKYWNHSVKLLRTFYPLTKIVIIDDNSNKNFIKSEYEYKNIVIIESAFPGRGELLPYYYYIKHKFFENAVIIHDSVFFHKKYNFENLKDNQVIPLWYFNQDTENKNNTIRITNGLKNSYNLKKKLSKTEIDFMNNINKKWYGCFGVQSYINHNFLLKIENKYNISNMIYSIQCKKDRCCLERIMGCIFYIENDNIQSTKSLFGNIMSYLKWGYTFSDYMEDFNSNHLPKNVVKVWTGR
jgi:hypothetical protein